MPKATAAVRWITEIGQIYFGETEEDGDNQKG